MPKHESVAKALRELVPDTSWAIHSGIDLETGKEITILQWHDPVVARPDHAIILATAEQIENEHAGPAKA